MFNLLRLGVLLGAVLLSACASRGDVAQAPALPVVDPVTEVLGQPEYRVGPHDLLTVTVFQIKDLDREVRVNNAGQISLPLIGGVQAAGRTVAELEADIARLYGARYLQDPQVTLFVKEFSSQRVTVNGAVRKTGIFPMNAVRLSLLQAVSLGEGLSETANPHHVAVLRRVEGRTMVARFDLEAIREGRMQDPEILGNDIVVVDESKGAVWFKRFIQIAPVLTSWFYYSN